MAKATKKGTVKQINPTIELTPEAKSKKRTEAIKDAIFDAINTTATTTANEHGETTINEVINVLTELAYSYNQRNLNSQFELEKLDQFNNQKK